MDFQNTKQSQFDKFKLTKADLKPEIHFIGQIVGGVEFENQDGLFCELAIDCGDNWELIQPGSNKGIQTQTCYANSGQMYVWGHPFELHFGVGDLTGWPKALIKVWRLDQTNKIDACSYGSVFFPRQNGFHQIICETWTPTGENIDYASSKPNDELRTQQGFHRIDRTLDWNFQALSFYMNNQPRLTNLQALTTDQGDYWMRKMFNSISSGKVIIEIDVILKNFRNVGYSGQ